MTEYDYLLQLKEQYDKVKTSSELKDLIDTFLETFPLDQN
ncbi:hypothetical protein NCCP28_05800 [Niallia sp. NCCP-28]|nr:hypothetical protein NCCP28_05800 [Niallia sp. NCCP-28]